ncbi:MAG: carbonic anhydrase family protein [Nitrospira sp. LK70]|nr:carbonic anhydrase family protein [Nitrospira sp. LK70]
MKTYLMKIASLGTLSILLTSPLGASDWNHTEESQGRDGTLWANIPGVPNENDAQMPLVFAACAVGSHQSPIAINLTKKTITVNPMIPPPQRQDNNPQAEPERHADSLEVRYAPSISSAEGSGISTDDGNAYVFRNTGHAVQVSFSKGYPGKLLVGKDVYPLVQFHFHTPSEHIVVTDKLPARKPYEGELHFVHQREDGGLAVLGVFLDASKHYAENPILKKIIENTPPEHNAYNTGDSGLPLDPSKLIPVENEHVFTYAGSLTTPPCSEGVSWYVMSEPLKVHSDQIKQLHDILKSNNNRIVQNTNSRTVQIHKDLQVDHDRDYHMGR